VAELSATLVKIANRSCQADPFGPSATLVKIANRSCQADPFGSFGSAHQLDFQSSKCSRLQWLP